MKNNVFISYSSKDRAFAQKLARELEQQGLSVWIDRDDIRAGIKWSSAIQEGLDQSAVIVIIISRDAMISKNVEDEWQYFLDKRKPIVPILYTPTDNIHFQLMRIQYIDFVNNSFEDAVQLLLYELHQYNISVDVPQSPTRVQAKSTPVSVPKAPTSSRNTILAIAGAATLIVIVLLGLLTRQNQNPIITPTSTVVTEEATSIPTATVLAILPTEVTAEPTETPIIATSTTPAIGVTLDIPYVSQFGTGANFPNDDGPAALLMVLRWYAKTVPDSETARRVSGLTVEDVGRAAGMTSTSSSVTFSGLIVAANSYRIPNKNCRGIDRARIFKELDNGHPVLILVDAKRFREELAFVGGHTVIVTGYNAEHVIIYDPHNSKIIPQPKIVSLSYDEFDNVIVNIDGLSVDQAQALIFGENNNQC